MRVSASRLRQILVLLFLAACVAASLTACSDSTTPTGDNGTEPPQGLRVEDFDSAGSCQSCHPDQFDQWSGSMHAYALKDPTFAALRKIGQSLYVNALDQGCVKCHSPIGSRSGALPWGPFDFDALPAVVREGIGCDLCHTITAIENLSDAGVILTPGKTKYGTIQNPVPNLVHESEYHPLYPTSEYCGSCHDLVTADGLQLEAVFREWRSGGFALTGKTCNDCHMPTYQGKATPDGPTRTLHDHSMVGADLALVDFPNRPEQLQKVTDMLRSALSIEADVPAGVTAGTSMDLQIRLINDRTGHNVPSGVPFIRQMWLSVVVLDGIDTVYVTGDFDANGDLKDDWSAFAERDTDLFNTQATMYRADSVRTAFTWEAAYLDNPTIAPGETRPVDYSIPVPPGASGPLRVEMKLRFRSFPHWVIRALGEDALLPIPIIDMWEDTRTVGVL